jgi:hypothetical protein
MLFDLLGLALAPFWLPPAVWGWLAVPIVILLLWRWLHRSRW